MQPALNFKTVHLARLLFESETPDLEAEWRVIMSSWLDRDQQPDFS